MWEEERLLKSFLDAFGKRKKTFKWPSQQRVEPADPEQVFMRGFRVLKKMTEIYTFHFLQEVQVNFQDCQEEFLEKQQNV